MRRILTITLCLALALAAFAALPVAAADDDYGFTIEGWYSDSHTQYGFIIDETEVAQNGAVPYYWYYDEIPNGAAIYVPVGYLNGRGDETNATFSMLGEKKDDVTISYKATTGSEYVESVTLVDGAKEKVDGLAKGAYAKIQLTDTYTGYGNGVKIVVNFGLSIRGVYYQDTDTQLTIRMWNPLVYITRNTVFGAQSPAQYQSNYYNGEVTFDMGDGVSYLAVVSSGGKYVINLSREANETIAENYPDAYLEFYNFRGNNDTFASTGRLSFPIDTTKFRDSDGNPTVYAYQIDGTTLHAIDSSSASYNTNTKTLTLSTQTLGNYVLSNRALHQEVNSGAEATFRSGYANQQQAETSEAPSSEEAGETAGGETQSDTQTETGVTATEATQTGVSSTETADEEIANGNVNTGAVINAANRATDDNPPTSAPRRMTGLMACAALLAAGFGAVYWKRARPFAADGGTDEKNTDI